MPADPDPFARVDPTDDRVFYSFERKVTHIEAGAIEALRDFYASITPSGGRVLDLMSSWRSHLPGGLGPVTGLGMNAAEMADNPALTAGFIVHDLNRQPRLPLRSAAFDACVCSVSVQYLVRPVEVWAEVRRVLKPGSPCAVSFSNRCFPTKAVLLWRATADADHLQVVGRYLVEAGFTDVTGSKLQSPDDPVWVVVGRS
jgi:SAM-dependent methyltransferase